VVHWGTYSLVQASLNGIATIYGKKIDHDYAILLSGQDYPTKTNAHIHRFLADLYGSSVIKNLPYEELPVDEKERFEHAHW